MNEFIVSTGSGTKVISSDNGSRGRVSRKGSRKGYTMDWDGIDYEAIAGKLENLGEDPWGLDFDDLFDLAESKGLTPDQFEREGSRKGGYYNDALQAHGVYHGHEDWEDEVFIPEDEAKEQLEDIAQWEGKTLDELASEMHRFRKENNK